jgi:hypothetical protein
LGDLFGLAQRKAASAGGLIHLANVASWPQLQKPAARRLASRLWTTALSSTLTRRCGPQLSPGDDG